MMPSSRTVMMATAGHQKRVVGDQREHGAEHEHLVGQRVEEGAAAGGALRRARWPSMPSVMQSAIQKLTAAHDGAVGHDHAEERHGERAAGDRDEVGRRGQRRRAELVACSSVGAHQQRAARRGGRGPRRR